MVKKIGPFIKKGVITVNTTDTIRKAIETMLEKDIGSVVVIDENQEGKAVGIITKTNIFKELLRQSPTDGSKLILENKNCGDIMSTPLITVTPDTPYTEAYDKFKKHKIDHLVVVDDSEKPIGVFSIRDIFLILNLEGFM